MTSYTEIVPLFSAHRLFIDFVGELERPWQWTGGLGGLGVGVGGGGVEVNPTAINKPATILLIVQDNRPRGRQRLADNNIGKRQRGLAQKNNRKNQGIHTGNQ